MDLIEEGVNLDDLDSLTDEIKALFQDTEEQATPPVNDDDTTQSDTEQIKGKEGAKQFAERLKEQSAKAVKLEQEKMAKLAGFNSYDEFVKSCENKIIEDKGFNPEELNPLINEVVETRLKNDPRLQELEMLKQKEAEQFAKHEIEELSKLTGGTITSFDDLPEAVINQWKTNGDLIGSYMLIEGKNLLKRINSTKAKTTTNQIGRAHV